VFDFIKKFTALLGLCLASIGALAGGLDRYEVDGFIDEMGAKHQFSRERLEVLFQQARRQPSILEAISRPAEKKLWYEYRPIFLTPSRIQGGAAFWSRNASALARAQAQYGVPAEVIVAIIGVETQYGGNAGNFRVIDALSTLAFHYPKRAPYFRQELENFLLLCRDEHLDPLRLRGSYAGAMGLPQFMPSSYRSYAVDSDGDGTSDIWQDAGDAIGSVANYLRGHGWESGSPVIVRARHRGQDLTPWIETGINPRTDLRQLEAAGISPERTLNKNSKAGLLAFDTLGGPEYWLGLPNFFVITTYNRSPMYAMAVYQLAQAIKERYG
jgi:membrane-bound lytic murein transglycosylase B